MITPQTFQQAMKHANRAGRPGPGERVTWTPVIPDGDIMLPNDRVLRRLKSTKIAEALEQSGSVPPLSYAEYSGPQKLAVIASIDPTPHGTLLHVSLSFPDRDPSWGVIKTIRYAFYPRDVDVMMVLPDDRDFVNIHTHCFQMWQTPTTWGMM